MTHFGFGALSTTSKVQLSSKFFRDDEHLRVRYPQNSATQTKNYAESSSWRRNKILDFGQTGPFKRHSQIIFFARPDVPQMNLVM